MKNSKNLNSPVKSEVIDHIDHEQLREEQEKVKEEYKSQLINSLVEGIKLVGSELESDGQKN